jgi:hypothetical protein
VFATRNLKLTGYAAVGRSGEHLQLTIEDELGHLQRSIWWQGAGYPLPEAKFDLAYSVRASTYRGQREVQLEWIDYRVVESEAAAVKDKKKPIEVIDWREEPEPLGRIKQLQGQAGLLMWGEADSSLRNICLDRDALFQAESLAIVTIPPGLNEIQTAIEIVKPNKVYLLGLNPGMDEPEALLKRLVGLLKNRIKVSDGNISLRALAAACAQRIQGIKTAIEWLDTYGYFNIISIEEDDVKIETGTRLRKENTAASSARLNAILAESAAFRRYYLSVAKERLTNFENVAFTIPSDQNN